MWEIYKIGNLRGRDAVSIRENGMLYFSSKLVRTISVSKNDYPKFGILMFDSEAKMMGIKLSKEETSYSHPISGTERDSGGWQMSCRSFIEHYQIKAKWYVADYSEKDNTVRIYLKMALTG